MAHEINNPLAYVTNNLAVLERDFRGLSEVLSAYEEARPVLATANPELAERIARLTVENDLPYIKGSLGAILKSTRQGAKRVSDIVQNLRGFARLDQAAIDRVDLHASIVSSLELIRGRLERNHIEVVQSLGEIPRIVCAPGPDQPGNPQPSAQRPAGDRVARGGRAAVSRLTRGQVGGR